MQTSFLYTHVAVVYRKVRTIIKFEKGVEKNLPCKPENASLRGPVSASPAATSSSSMSSSCSILSILLPRDANLRGKKEGGDEVMDALGQKTAQLPE